jgi:phage internal scaffolding protein
MDENNKYNYTPNHNRKVTIDASKDGRTQQHLKDECDINRIMERHRVTGMVTHLTKGEPQYGDFSNLGDYQDALNTMIRAEDAFMSLDAHVRRKFENDPQQLINFLDDTNNDQEAIEMGLKVGREQAPSGLDGAAPGSQEPEPKTEPAE